MSYVEFLVVKVLGNLIVPPGGVIVLGVLGLMLLPFARRLAGFLLLVMVVSLYTLSTGSVAGMLERGLYEHPALAPDAEVPAAGAIVVLGAGSYRDPPEYEGADTVGRFTLERLRYAAWLHRRSGLPLLVTGGRTFPGTPAEAGAMALSLKDDFGIGVRFVEDRSRNTADNAVNSAQMLADAGIDRILLVTHALHMTRAVGAFEGQGLEVVAAPTGMSNGPAIGAASWLPTASAFARSSAAVHEYIGLAWYRLRF